MCKKLNLPQLQEPDKTNDKIEAVNQLSFHQVNLVMAKNQPQNIKNFKSSGVILSYLIQIKSRRVSGLPPSELECHCSIRTLTSQESCFLTFLIGKK